MFYQCEQCRFSTDSTRTFTEHARRTGHNVQRPPVPTHEEFKSVVKWYESADKKNLLAKAVAAKRGRRSLRTLAAELGEPHSSIQCIEQGRIPKPRLFIKLVNWLGVISSETAETLMKYTK